jgi:phospholipase C
LHSPSWSSSVFILTYDEGGGLYDHVPPVTLPAPDSIPPMLKSGDLPGNFTTSGFRVPMIVISPWSKPHFVSHVKRDHSSILKLIETRFGLPALTQRDAQADSMTEFFDFSSPHWLTPPAMPSQPTSGACSFSLEKAPGF